MINSNIQGLKISNRQVSFRKVVFYKLSLAVCGSLLISILSFGYRKMTFNQSEELSDYIKFGIIHLFSFCLFFIIQTIIRKREIIKSNIVYNISLVLSILTFIASFLLSLGLIYVILVAN
jgi:hypothetical protein